MSSSRELRTTVTRAFAATEADPSQRAPLDSISDEEAADLPGVGDLVGLHYRLVRVLGEGMFGTVYVAERVDVVEHQVALKVLRRSHYVGRNVERELVMLATVGHPNVVQLKDHGMGGDYVWLTMPVYEGETLAERLKRGPLTLREAYDIFLPVARGLEALHAAGLRHQDVKPDNIFLAVFGGRLHPILLDLGVAAEREATFVAGTALFAAPEQLLAITGLMGALPLTEKMDTYCTAASLLYSLVEKEHFPGDDAKSRDEIAAAHEVRSTKPIAEDLLPELSGEPRRLIVEAFCKWLAHDPEDRPNISEFAEQLEVLLEPERELAREEERWKSRQKTSLLRFRLAAAGLALGGIAAGAIAYSQRETLRLASALEAAQEQGAEQFDKLDTCVASHRVARARVVQCRQRSARDRAEFDQTLSGIVQSGNASEAERAKRLRDLQATFTSRLNTCEEDAKAAEEAHTAETAKMTKEFAEKQKTLEAERDEANELAESRATQLTDMEDQRDQCIEVRVRCEVDRDACLAESATYPVPTGTPPPPPPPPGTAEAPEGDVYDGPAPPAPSPEG